MQPLYIVGIDEVGRGPLAGPVAVGVAVVSKDFDWSQIEGVTDSKKLSSKKRAAFFRRAKELKKEGELDFAVAMVSAKKIDEIGIARAIATAMTRAIKRLNIHPENCYIKLDGSLKAPAEYKQETIIKGDLKEKVIGLASICAKETRDSYMIRVSQKFPEYCFEEHMGYGTEKHRSVIKMKGVTVEHRKSYCRNCQVT